MVYTDSIPLFAVFFKLLSPVLPAQFQYFGLFELLCYLLMGAFGALLTARFTKNLFLDGISAFLFVISPVLTKRVFYHSALSAHFLILMAMAIWIYRDELKEKREFLCWVLLGVLATTINAYYVPMVMGIMCMRLLQELLEKRSVKQLPTVFVFVAASLFTGYLLGMFEGKVSFAAANMENVSFNLLGFVNPKNEMLRHVLTMPLFSFDSEQSYSRFYDGFANLTPWQSEGFSYMGLGMLAAVLVAVILWLHKTRKRKDALSWGEWSRILSIGAGALVFLALALGPRAALGQHILYDLQLGEGLYRLLSVFRTTGRLIWPVYYGLMTLTLVGLAKLTRELPGAWRRILFAAVLVLQILDISPSLMEKHDVYANVSASDAYENPLMETAAFAYLGEEAEEILFVSPTRAISLRPYWSTLFEDYALQNGMRMNAAYCSRDITQAADAYADENIRLRKAGEYFPNILYVFTTEDIAEQYKEVGLHIYGYEDIFIGTDLDLGEYTDAKGRIG